MTFENKIKLFTTILMFAIFGVLAWLMYGLFQDTHNSREANHYNTIRWQDSTISVLKQDTTESHIKIRLLIQINKNK
jgi:TRAP-type C4-dicarboxylate transport system permease small subunit